MRDGQRSTGKSALRDGLSQQGKAARELLLLILEGCLGR